MLLLLKATVQSFTLGVPGGALAAGPNRKFRWRWGLKGIVPIFLTYCGAIYSLIVIWMHGLERRFHILWSEMHKCTAACQRETNSSKCGLLTKHILNHSTALAFDFPNRIHHLQCSISSQINKEHRDKSSIRHTRRCVLLWVFFKSIGYCVGVTPFVGYTLMVPSNESELVFKT